MADRTEVREPARSTRVAKDVDVVVAGGGLAGVCAAVASARAGASTLLVERNTCAGGVATASLEPSICNYFHTADHRKAIGGAPLEFIERLVALGAASANWSGSRVHVVYDVELGKLAFDQMLEDAGVEVLYDTLAADAIVEDDCLRGVIVQNRSGRQAVLAGSVVDATGDADVAALAGTPMRDGPAMVHSFLFRLGNVDLDETFRYIIDHPENDMRGHDIDLTIDEWAHAWETTGILLFHHHAATKMPLIQDAIANGTYTKEWGPFKKMDAFQMHGIRSSGTLVVNTGYFEMAEPDAEQISYYMRWGRKLAHHVGAFLRDTLPGCRDSFVCATASDLGLRRTRWIDGEFTFTREMQDAASRFPDAIGRGVVMEPKVLRITDRTYDVPLRALLPRGPRNLIIGSGRSTSSTPAETLRTMPLTMVVGQGAGVAAALAAKTQRDVRDVPMADLQSELVRQGVLFGD